MYKEVQPEDFLHLHMQHIIDEYIPQDNLPSLFLELKMKVKDLQEAIASKEDIEIIWKLGAWIGRYIAETCDFYEGLYHRKET